MGNLNLEYIILMKVGSQSDETLDQIVERKAQEEIHTGKIFWGYGGTVCHPIKQVHPFAQKAIQAERNLTLVMVKTSSHFDSWRRANEYSIDTKTWKPIPNAITVKTSQYAIVCKNLRRVVDLKLDISRYSVGVGKQKDTPLKDYFRSRVDKACAYVKDATITNEADYVYPIEIAYVADVIDPYAVMLR